MRPLISKSAAPYQRFAEYYVFVVNICKAYAILQFYIHLLLKFIINIHIGVWRVCYPSKLIAAISILYNYAENSVSEASVAKRRFYSGSND